MAENKGNSREGIAKWREREKETRRRKEWKKARISFLPVAFQGVLGAAAAAVLLDNPPT